MDVVVMRMVMYVVVDGLLSVSMATETPLPGLPATLVSGRRFGVLEEAGDGRGAGAGADASAGLRSDA